MEIKDYRMRAMSTCLDTSSNYTYMLQGLIEEIGELSGVVAKAKRKGWVTINFDKLTITSEPTLDQREEIEANIKKELGDILWMLNGLCIHMGTTLEEVAELNLAKLADRQKRGVIDGKGDNR